MPWFQCLIRGEKFPGILLGETGTVGFYTTRRVEAADPDEAELVGVAALKRDPSFALPEGTARPTEPRVYVEEIVELAAAPESEGKGATWFVEADDAEADDAIR